jgi:hypothetical protein
MSKLYSKYNVNLVRCKKAEQKYINEFDSIVIDKHLQSRKQFKLLLSGSLRIPFDELKIALDRSKKNERRLIQFVDGDEKEDFDTSLSIGTSEL